MKMQKGFGVGNQGFHPRARDNLRGDQRKQKSIWHNKEQAMMANYFVPSFSIRRHVHRSDEAYWLGIQPKISRLLGRHFMITPPENIAIKSIEQKALIQTIRASNNQPTSEEMRDAVFNIRDGLTEALATAPDPLEMPLGRLAVFGRAKNKLGFEIAGWKGWRGRYALKAESGEMTPLGALVLENQVALGGIATALFDTNFAMNQVAANPHLTIATGKSMIRDHELRRIQEDISALEISKAYVGDPIIEFKPNIRADSEMFHIRHSYDSLALQD